MVYVCAVAEIGRDPVSKTEKAGARWDSRTYLARPNSQARKGNGRILFFSVQLTTSRTFPPVDPHYADSAGKIC